MDRAERIATNESRFREINERLQQDLRAVGATDDERIAFVCECGLLDCHEAVTLTLGEYEVVRGDPRRFAVLPGHELTDVEAVVGREEGFFVVEKIVAHDVVEGRDPRSGPQPG